jgi:cyclic pyranopterin phosphate synthase
MSSRFSHLDEHGGARMVDVSAKAITRREARASCVVRLGSATVARLSELPKGDAVTVARIAGIQGAKRASDWIPLAHPLILDEIAVDIEPCPEGVAIRSRVVVHGRTGAEMEALTACAAAALALFDMVKAVERSAVITELRVDGKTGGKSGDWTRE